MNIEQFINGSPFFKELSEVHRCEVANISAYKEVSKRDYLFHEGEKGSSMFLLVEGNVQLHKNTEDGREVVIRVIKPGEIFAEVVLFEKERYPVSARAVTNVHLLIFPREGIHRLLAEEGFRNDFVALLMAKQRYLTERIQELTTKDVEHRLFTFLRTQYGEKEVIHTPLSKKDIAAAIGTTPESLSRLILRLHDEKAVIWQGKEIRILTDSWK
ncbi:Crp/Fnr family transcriptional regulator [Pontiella sulfatireligans]|uniref:Anaerobic regulatory protein n=1 Tax=Pontiella sulfatireligans TaxID=2750658 RepID=A0A6C2URQ2_9BACT|nr:Crp/Fnr family transcriptional regulator [Pontiella sulfatireligans]VGO22633.1 Anaerobic regulatory protein [Pontiella sulfatireligans]